MLASNHICAVQAQNFKVMQNCHIQSMIPCSNSSVLLPLNQMFINNPNLAYAYACEAYKLFMNQKRCSESDFQSSYTVLASYGVALSSLFFAYEIKTGKMALYTSSVSILKQLTISLNSHVFSIFSFMFFIKSSFPITIATSILFSIFSTFLPTFFHPNFIILLILNISFLFKYLFTCSIISSSKNNSTFCKSNIFSFIYG